jgi:hypothetical protein
MRNGLRSWREKMKKSMLFIMIIMAGWALSVHAATIGKVVKVQGNLLLIRFESQTGKEGDTVHISRETADGLVPIGTARVMRMTRDQAGAKILTQQPGVSIKPGDLITDVNDSVPLSYSDQMADGFSAMEKLLFISNPVPVEGNVEFEKSTALEKIWLNMRGE